MSGQNVIPLHPDRPVQSAGMEDGAIAMLVFVIFEAMMFAGMVLAFMLTRAAAGAAWPPAGQPWFPLAETAINTAALLTSGALVFLAARAWEKREAQASRLLLAAIALGACFVVFQGIAWVSLILQGLTVTSSQHGKFFCLIVGAHGIHALAALILLGVAWRRLRPVRDHERTWGTLGSGAFPVARILWYFVVGSWPVLYLCLYF
jgi:heme/copper-type cytochrome/quinol oxidase subunit 3